MSKTHAGYAGGKETAAHGKLCAGGQSAHGDEKLEFEERESEGEELLLLPTLVLAPPPYFSTVAWRDWGESPFGL